MPGILFGDGGIWHGGQRIDCGRILNPAHQIFRCIGQYAGNVDTACNAAQRRAHQAVRAFDSGNDMAGPAAVSLYGLSSALWITAGYERPYGLLPAITGAKRYG